MLKKPTVRSREEWDGILSELDQSGETHAAFCERKGLSLHTLQYHRSKNRQKPSTPKFSEMTLSLPSDSPEYEIRSGKISVLVKGPIVGNGYVSNSSCTVECEKQQWGGRSMEANGLYGHLPIILR